MIKLNIENVIMLHDMLLEQSGGLQGIRDENLLESAIESVYQTFDDQELYPTIEEKGARMCYSLISNHAFADGNKRIGILVMLSFFELNGINLKYSDDDLIKIGIHIADGSMDYETLVKWVFASEISAGLDNQQNSAVL
jgi:death-on-curing protein